MDADGLVRDHVHVRNHEIEIGIGVEVSHD